MDHERQGLRCGQPTKWTEITEEKYDYYLEVLPPAIMTGNGFMVGEPWDHNAEGYPRYQACVRLGGKFYASDDPMTVRQFKGLKPTDVRG